MENKETKPKGDDGKAAISVYVYRHNGEWETKIRIPIIYSKEEALEAIKTLVLTLLDPEKVTV